MNSPAGVSEAASLAVHATALLAGSRGRRMSARHMAESLGASEAHLSKVLARLAKAGIVKGRRGPSGGFVLARRPERISIREVYEAIEGRIEPRRCLLGIPVCGRRRCAIGELFARVNRDLARALGRMTVADLRFRGAN